jgi:hypothetical protein
VSVHLEDPEMKWLFTGTHCDVYRCFYSKVIIVVVNILLIISGLLVSVLAMGPSVVGSGLTGNDGFLWVIKICIVLPSEGK